MKRILTTTALAIALAAPAAADTDMLRNVLENRFEDVDVSTLTDEQVRALYAATAGEDSAADIQGRVDSIVADSQYEMDEEAIMADPDEMARMGGSNDLRNVVADMLATREIDADVATLTDEQVSALYLELTDSEPSNTELEAIIQ
ncbi:hypothetical protein DLJ49_07810 [Rhodovulum sp. 12E13]|uniref:hypothetical protein n=1 Tax=Rhodovulum sp. 12E13 TaxID=2203891 RepID=UPI000E14993B|nr:hypothetical protein [Rhodovulum sp. 12E13]RDC73457.1 hypothetical protein DLJ49_07810 [Rhodovulum sp. 12E13]